jgi:hypothetical protein
MGNFAGNLPISRLHSYRDALPLGWWFFGMAALAAVAKCPGPSGALPRLLAFERMVRHSAASTATHGNAGRPETSGPA